MFVDGLSLLIHHVIVFEKILPTIKVLGFHSPLSVLDRGYAIALNEAGEAVKDAETLKPGDKLSLRLARGTRQVIVDDSA